MSTTTSSHDFIDDALERVTDMVDEAPEFKNIQKFLEWFASLITVLTVAINSIALNIHRRLTAVERSSSSIASSTATVTTTPTAPSVTATQGSTQRDTAAAAQRQARCTQCHARGHTAALCRTSNPAAMRKRVARNSRIAKEARTYRNMSTIPAPAPPPYLQPATTSTPVATLPMNYASLAADATELRRRAAQSARDKRLRRRAQTTTS